MANDRLNTNFNVNPYFDDYDPDKRFYRILFRPAKAVQARELTQVQDILQDQIRRFANYNFKDGSIIDGCGITYHPSLDFVHVKNFFNTDPNYAITNLKPSYLITNSLDSTNAVRAIPFIVEQGFENQYPETNRIYLKYIASGRDAAGNQLDTFQPGDTLYIFNENQEKLGTLDTALMIDSINVMDAATGITPIGKAYGITVTDGIIYQKGFFQKVVEHSIVVNPYDTNPEGYVVGFETTENIITPEADSSLYSNAAGFPNYGAPGAHRLQLVPTLVAKKKVDLASDSNFFAIVEFDADRPTEQNTGEETLNVIRDVMAKRTYEESGNYVIKPFTVETVPHETNASLFTYEISPGIVYVNGYRVEKLNTYRVDTDRANTTDESLGELITGNYGNYVLVKEYAGAFDFKHMERVALYDSNQNAISGYSGTANAPLGNIIGYANVRLVKYDSGRKGVFDTRYRVYLTNIAMNSGRSFSEVKSLVGASAKADLVTSEILEASRNTLVFDFGIDAVKRLRDKNGNINNTYVLKDSSTATLGTDGVVTFTTNTPPNGGTERLAFGIGLLSDTNEIEEFEIILSSEMYTANLPGTVDLTGNTTITGTGTTFTTHFKAGDLIYLAGAGGNYVRRIVSVDSDTQITIDADVADTATAATYKKYYPAGHVVDLSWPGATINIISDTQFTVTTNLDLGAGPLEPGTQTVTGYYPIQRSQSVETQKIIKKNRYVKIDPATHANGTTGPWNLGFTDVHKIRAIHIGSTYDVNNPDRKDWFIIDNGQRDDVYDFASIQIKPQYKDQISSATKILVELDYFDVDTTAGRGFFAVDSYPVDDANPTASTAISTAEIPVFKSGLNGNVYDLRNCVDFRYRYANTATDTIDPATASENPVADKTALNIPDSVHVIEADKNFQADIEYYLPRIDLICMDNQGNIIIRKGDPDINPVEPKNEVDTIVLARSDVAPYPSLTTRENEIYRRPEMTIKTRFRAIKRYTMKDIDSLEKRISRMEYYTTLNLLEQKAKDMVIPDENGLNRFKNGIFADSFNSHLGGKVNDIEYSIAIDKDFGIARPLFKTRPIDLRADLLNSTGIKKVGHYLLLDYIDEKFIEQKYATKYRNCTANMWHWNGNISLYPSYDHYRDERYTPAVNVELDLSSPWEEFANSGFATNFGDWRVVNRDTTVTTAGDTITTTTETTSERVITGLNVDTTTETFDLGTYVNDFSISPYMRSRLVAIVVTGLKPSTRMHVFFDGKNVDEHCTPAVFSGKTDVEVGKEHEILNPTGQYGDPIYTDANGQFLALFRIPEQTFRVGDRPLVVTNIDDLETGADAQIASAQAIFTASNISVTKNDLSLTTYNPDVTSFTTTEQRVEISETTTTVTPPSIGIWSGGDGGVGGDPEPIAQTFKIIPPHSNLSGMFISQFGVFFKSKDNTLGCSIYVTEVDSGYPNGSRIIGKAHLDAVDIQISNDASLETVFTLENPVFLNANKEYAFIVHPDGNSPEYEIWCSEIGDFDITTNEQVFSNPYSGILYVSANMMGWTALQGEDLKFNIYRCKFTSNAGTAKFENEDDDYFTVDGFVNNGTNRIQVGDAVYRKVSGVLITDPNSTDYGYGTVQFVDEGENILIVDGSNGKFVAGDAIEIHRPVNGVVDATTLIASANIVSIDNPEMHVVVPRFGDMMPALTNIEYQFAGSDSSGNLESTFIKVANDYDTELLDKPRFIFSKSNETLGKTVNFVANMKSYSEYLSPVIDLRRKSFLAIENLINDDSTDEHLRTGNAKTKYVSLNVTLDSNLGPAEDMRAYVGAYRPANTDIEVYVKLQGADDGDPFDDKLWTKMEMTPGSKNLYSAPFDTTDYKEFEFRMPTEILAQVGNKTTAYLNANGVTEYVRDDGAVIVGYQTFSFKIVLKAASGHRAPRLNDFRAISLQA